MCFGSKVAGGDGDNNTTPDPPARRTEVKDPNLFRTPTFAQGKQARPAGRRESHASGHSPSESLRQKPERTTDEVTGAGGPGGAVVATDIGAGTATPEIQGINSVGRTGEDGIVR